MNIAMERKELECQTTPKEFLLTLYSLKTCLVFWFRQVFLSKDDDHVTEYIMLRLWKYYAAFQSKSFLSYAPSSYPYDYFP